MDEPIQQTQLNNQNQNQSRPEQEQAAPQPEAAQNSEPQKLDTGADAQIPEHAEVPNRLPLLIIGGLLLLFFIVASAFLIKQSSQKKSATAQPGSSTPQTIPTEPAPSPTPQEAELTVPTISEDTNLETIQKELDSLELSSPDSELDALDQETAQL